MCVIKMQIIFYHNINVKENVFRWKRHCVTNWRKQSFLDSFDNGKLANQIARLVAIVIKFIIKIIIAIKGSVEYITTSYFVFPFFG